MHMIHPDNANKLLGETGGEAGLMRDAKWIFPIARSRADYGDNMKALVYRGPRAIELSDVPDPDIIDDRDVIVEVKACSICGSDLHIYSGHTFTADTGYCVGHEAVGEIVEVGKRVQNRKVGDLVMLPGAISCGACGPCRAGLLSQCVETAKPSFAMFERCYGLSNALQGSQAQAVRVPNGDCNAHLIPDGVTIEQAVMLTDAASTAWFGCELARVHPGAAVGILGGGPIGLVAIEICFVLGASRVFVIDPVPERRAMAEALGATAYSPDEAEASIREETKGFMLASVIEAAGSEAALNQAFRLAGRAGTIGAIGVNGMPTFALPFSYMMYQGLTLSGGPCPIPKFYPTLIPLLQQGRLHPEKVITSRRPLAEGAQAYREAHERSHGMLKTILIP